MSMPPTVGPNVALVLQRLDLIERKIDWLAERVTWLTYSSAASTQESSDSVSKMHRHFPGQIVDKRHQSEFNQRCESIITALAGCAKAVRLMAPDWVQIKPSSIHAGNRLWR